MKELALIRAYKFAAGEYASAVPYFVCDTQGNLIPDEYFDLYVNSKNLILQDFYGFELIAPKITSHIYQEFDYVGLERFGEDAKAWFNASRTKFSHTKPMIDGWIVEWYAVYEFESGFDMNYDGGDYWYEFTYLGQLDEINIEILTADPIDKNNN